MFKQGEKLHPTPAAAAALECIIAGTGFCSIISSELAFVSKVVWNVNSWKGGKVAAQKQSWKVK